MIILATLITVVLLAQDTAGSTQQKTHDQVELIRLERTWNEAHLRGDAAALDRLWVDDFQSIVPRMQPLSKSDALSMLSSGRIRFERYETSDIRLRVYGDSAVATGRLRRTRRMSNQHVDDDWQFTKTYIRQDAQWKVVAFHASEAPR